MIAVAEGKKGKRGELLEGIQILRAVAALLVVLHHALEESLAAIPGPKSPDWLTTFGAAGVDIFFVISGFIMLYVSFPAGGPPASPRSFLFSRITRIYPLYWICLATLIALKIVVRSSSLPGDPNVFLRSILLLPDDYMILGPAWTLVYEMYFYIIFAATLTFAKPLISLVATTAAILILYTLANFAPDAALREFLGDPIAFEFCLGLTLATIYWRWPRLIVLGRPLWFFGFALLAIAPLMVNHVTTNSLPSPERLFAWGVPAFLIALSFLALKFNRTRLQRIALLCGDASYAIYLTHPLVMVSYAKLLKGQLANFPQWPIIPFVIVISAGLGILVHVFVERPVMASVRGLRLRVRNSVSRTGLP